MLTSKVHEMKAKPRSMTKDDGRTTPPSPDPSQEREANTMIATGIGVGVLGAVSAAIGGAVCPVCVIAAPLLVGVGAIRRARARRP